MTDSKRKQSAHDNAVDAPPLRFEMLSQPRYLSAVRAMLMSLTQRFGFDEHDGNQISLAVDEALCNVINHGYSRRDDGRIWVSVWPIRDPAGLKFVIEDIGRQVNVDEIKPRNLDDIRPGGLGVHIIREVMDEVVYEQRSEGGMRLTLVKHISGKDGQSHDHDE